MLRICKGSYQRESLIIILERLSLVNSGIRTKAKLSFDINIV
jgi:hypothetical protein